MNRLFRIGLACAATFAALAANANSPAAVSAVLRLAEPAPEEVRAGTPITLEIALPESADAAAWRIAGAPAEKWWKHGPVLLNLESVGPVPDDPRRLRLSAVVTASGQHTIPPLALQAENNSQRIETNSLSLTAESNLGPEDKEPVWMLPPMPYGAWNLPLILGLIAFSIAAVGALAYLIWRWLRKRRAAPGALPADTALAELLALERFVAANADLGIQECKRFSFGLSATLRRFFSAIYRADFLDLTDAEVAQRALDIGVEPAKRGEISAILAQIAEVRYSRKLIAADTAREILGRTRSLVQAIAAAQAATAGEAAKANRRPA